MTGRYFCREELPYLLWGLGVLFCAAPVFSQRREGRAEVRDDAVVDLLAGCGVCCRPGAAWDLRRCFVFRPSSFLLPGAVAPHPSSFSCVCVVCVVLWRGGVSCGVSVCFSFGCSWWVRAGLVNSVGLRGYLLGVGRMRVGG